MPSTPEHPLNGTEPASIDRFDHAQTAECAACDGYRIDDDLEPCPACTEPPEGTRVRDGLGRAWVRDDGPYGGPGQANWVSESGGHETWRKVSGNYGPVELA